MSAVDRRQFLAVTSATAIAGSAGRLLAAEKQRDVPWLQEIQTPPDRLPAEAPRLSDLLTAEDGRRITTVEAWQERRKELEKWWLDFLGPMPALRNADKPPKLTVVEEDEPEGLVRQLVRYEIEPGLETEAYLLRPGKASARMPGVVVFHSTVDHSIHQPAGVEGAPEKAFGLSLARKGCVTFCPRNFLWPETGRIVAQQETERFLKRAPRSKGMAKMLFDALVASDILAAQPDVDPEILGAVGHSLGAKEVLYLAAFDERIKCTVSSEGGVGTRFSNWDAPWYLGPSIKEPSFTHEHHELLALAAPRPFLLVGGNSADGDQGWPFIEAALPVYELFGKPARFGQFNHGKGHAVPPEAEKRIEGWMATYL